MLEMDKLTFDRSGERVIDLDADRYVRIKTYRTQGPELSSLSDKELIETLLHQPFYDHLLVGPVGYEKKDQHVQGSGQHGPFALERLSPKLYRRLSEEEFRRRLQEHYDDPFYLDEGVSTVRGEAAREIEHFLEALPLRSCRILSLELDSADRSYWGEMPLHSDFNEYILVEQDRLHFFIIAWD